MYVFGPFIVGALIGAENPRAYFSPLCLAFALFFLFPANLLIYGVNDIFDYETDVLNLKKRGYENLVPPDERAHLAKWIFAVCAPFALLVPFLSAEALWMLGGFVFFSIFYSAPPIRAKSKPILDSVFNVLYIFPGAMGYFLAGGQNFSMSLFVAAWLWAMAMHAYSAVPDIGADKEAGVPTVATFLGLRPTIAFCAALYFGAMWLSSAALGFWAGVLGLVYLGLMAQSWRANSEGGVMRIYRVFPFVNALAGASLWWFAALQKPSFWPFSF
mgnify:CR=1 FL=1